jgi:hypothetical protein
MPTHCESRLLPLFTLMALVAMLTCIDATPPSYSYGSTNAGQTSTCAAGATFLSSSLGCAPAIEPADTVFYLSCSKKEGVLAFPTNVNSAFATGPFNVSDTALLLQVEVT